MISIWALNIMYKMIRKNVVHKRISGAKIINKISKIQKGLNKFLLLSLIIANLLYILYIGTNS